MALIYSRLSTETKCLHNVTVAVDVTLLEVVKESTTLTNELCKRTSCLEILVVSLEVLCKMLDAEREKSNLALCRTCVCC